MKSILKFFVTVVLIVNFDINCAKIKIILSLYLWLGEFEMYFGKYFNIPSSKLLTKSTSLVHLTP